MHLMTIENISKSYGEKPLFENISLSISDGEKIGLIGINGTGKSTLLKIVAGLVEPDKGNIIRAGQLRIEYLPQNPEFDFNATVLEQIFKGNSPEMKLLREYEDTLNKVSKGDMTQNDHLMKLQNKIDQLNLWNLESEAKTILTKLDIHDFEASIGTLSGGQRKRIALASALITPSELLILDEPTNHMDSETITWMEEYLNKRKGAVLIITHDRYFLDRVTNRIIELDNGELYSYEGNYSVFVEKRIERQELEAALQRKRENLFRKELAWIKRGARARTTKQKARIERFEQLKEDMVQLSEDKLELSVQGSRLGNKIIEIEDVSKRYDEHICIKDFSYILLRDDRIGIVGPNGAGKTTLMKIISGDIIPDAGKVDRGETVKIGFFSQENYHLDEDMRVIEYVKEIGEYLPLSNGDRISASKMLERFLFPSDLHYARIGNLSGGEKRRLYLLSVLMGAPNVLLFDEPTNDLDIATLTILEDFLDNFNGPVIVVSHDRYFLDRVCHKIFSYEGEGTIVSYNGNYSDFLDRIEDRQEDIQNKGNEVKKEKVERNKTKALKFTYKEQKEYEVIDQVIEDLENKIESLDEQMELHAAEYSKITEIMEEKEKVEALLEEKYERWTYLNELAEKIENQKKK